jgi:hypothetical protein
MGMFDSLKVKVPLPLSEELQKLPLNWEAEEFQTKDLENLLDQYEITKEGQLMHLMEQREWEKDPSSPLGGFMKLLSQEWVAEPFHGVISFYTTFCDNPSAQWDHGKDAKQISWSDIMETEGFDWWIEFIAIFDEGKLRDIRLGDVSKTLIRSRLASHKEWSEKREAAQNTPFGRVTKLLGKSKLIKRGLHQLYRWEQKGHEKVSRFLLRLGQG